MFTHLTPGLFTFIERVSVYWSFLNLVSKVESVGLTFGTYEVMRWYVNFQSGDLITGEIMIFELTSILST